LRPARSRGITRCEYEGEQGKEGNRKFHGLA
jgi:hypothetical protein